MTRLVAEPIQLIYGQLHEELHQDPACGAQELKVTIPFSESGSLSHCGCRFVCLASTRTDRVLEDFLNLILYFFTLSAR
jgi:hypothetical protein